jgi:hypothetical protein
MIDLPRGELNSFSSSSLQGRATHGKYDGDEENLPSSANKVEPNHRHHLPLTFALTSLHHPQISHLFLLCASFQSRSLHQDRHKTVD